MSYEVHFGGNTHICNAKKLKTVLIFGEVMDGYILYFKMAAMNKPTFAVWVSYILCKYLNDHFTGRVELW